MHLQTTQVVQASMRPQSAGVSGMRPSDAWAHNKSAPAYSSFPSDIRHTRTQQNLVENNCEIPSLQQSQFEEVQLGMLLGGSSSGNVYRGMWRSIPVAVKVHGLVFKILPTQRLNCSCLCLAQSVLYCKCTIYSNILVMLAVGGAASSNTEAGTATCTQTIGGQMHCMVHLTCVQIHPNCVHRARHCQSLLLSTCCNLSATPPQCIQSCTSISDC